MSTDKFKPFDLEKVKLEGSNLIEASAGTGKTFAIANLYLRFLIEKEIKVRQILVVTFTDAATQELKDRIRKNISNALMYAEGRQTEIDEVTDRIIRKNISLKGSDNLIRILKRAVLEFDEASIFTIHGFCKQMLSDSSFESFMLFDTELIADQTFLTDEVVFDFWRRVFNSDDPLPSAMAVKNKLTVDSFRSFAINLLNRPMLKIIPEQFDVSFERMRKLFDKTAAEWKKSERDIEEILNTPDCFSKNQKDGFPPSRLENLFQSLQLAFSRYPSADGLTAINAFSSSNIAKQVSSKYRGKRPGHKFFDLCEEFLRLELSVCAKVKKDFADYFRTEFYRRKKKRNIQGFDDLLLNLYNAIVSGRGKSLINHIRKSFSAAMIDEFQDTDPVQYKIFNSLFNTGSHAMFMIGDPKQSIFGFRGADVFSYLEAVSNTQKSRRFTLSLNWRSQTEVVKAVNSLFSIRPDVFILENFIFHPVKPTDGSRGNKKKLLIKGEEEAGVVLWEFYNTEKPGNALSKDAARQHALTATVAEISRLLDLSRSRKAMLGQEPLKPSDIAILVTQNRDAMLFIEPLSELNIPAVLKKTGNVFQSDEAMEIETILHAVVAPSDERRVLTALSTDVAGVKADALKSFLDDESRTADFEEHVRRFTNYSAIWKNGDFIKMFRLFLVEYRARKNLLGFPDGDRRLTNVLHLLELLHRQGVEKRLGPESLLNWLCQKRLDKKSEQEEEELRLERDDEAVQILTVHKSKGLEYPVVFLPFMWQPRIETDYSEVFFHKEGGDAFLDIGSGEIDINREEALKENMSEQMRTMYVGLTRAINRCYLTYGNIGKKQNIVKYFFSPQIDYETGSKGEKQDLDKEASVYYAEPPGSLQFKKYISEGREPLKLVVREFKNSSGLQTNWGLASYSLITSIHQMAAEEDQQIIDEPAKIVLPDQLDVQCPTAFFAFPKGANAGLSIHDVFENIDFSLSSRTETEELIKKSLARFSIEPSCEETVGSVFKMAENVLKTELFQDNRDFSLSALLPDQRIHELNFFFPLNMISPAMLTAFFSKHTPLRTRFIQRLKNLNFTPINGFMQGFIDLVFGFNNRYYILDWKTNHLGNRFKDYCRENIEKSMEESLYIIQYYIYTIALHRYLQARLSGYSYVQNFGGVFYMYVRGIKPDLPGNGIYYDMPPLEAVEEFSSLIACSQQQ